MQTILGSGGAVGIELAKSLTQYTKDIRLVSRNPKKINVTDSLFPADVLDKQQLFTAIAGSEIVYVTVGFNYETKLWQQVWPTFMQNVIAACLQNNCKLVFFDNVYAIGGDNVNHITENSPISPVSKKGEARAIVDRLILDAVENKNLSAIIARSADFFGGPKEKSLLMNLIYDNMIKGKKSQWFCNAKVIHSCSYTPDLGKGTAILGNTPDAYNQIWNLPTDAQKITGEGWINLFAEELNAKNNYTILSKTSLRILGVFIPILREMVEMCYQFDRDYFFDSAKFNARFNYTPTSNALAVKDTVAELKKVE